MLKRRVMIIDDSVVARRAIANAIDATHDIEVAASAANGRIGLQKLGRIQPDVVLLDVEMPEMDGLQTLAAIRNAYPTLPVIMFSALTGKGAKTTLEALALGANDYATKPNAAAGSLVDQLGTDLFPKIRALCKGKGQPLSMDISALPPRDASKPRKRARPEVLLIGASTGGPNALTALFGALCAPLPVPVLIVQHMPAIFTRKMAERLDDLTPFTVQEAIAGDTLRPDCVYIAPGDHHLAVARQGADPVTVLHQEPPENSCRPAVDVLFRSAADVFGARALAVMLTGMGRDGLDGCRHLFDRGAQILCQDETSSVVWGMPGYVAKAGLADDVLPLDDLAEQIGQRLAFPATPLEESERPR